ncbi:MAG: hypothetical protein ACJAWW_001205 [Sulfurimonas sp.]|jgi:hypothetical protein
MFRAFMSYMKGLLGLHPTERNYEYFNPEGDFQDIRGLMPIEDATMIPFIILLVFILCFMGWGLYKIIKHIKYKKSIQAKVLAKKYLLALDMDDAKTCAYTFSIWAPHLIKDDNMTAYEELEEKLFKYKYKKSTKPLALEEQKTLNSFLETNHG